jgi:hypothetical protein
MRDVGWIKLAVQFVNGEVDALPQLDDEDDDDGEGQRASGAAKLPTTYPPMWEVEEGSSYVEIPM